jgi:hypothetical protein
MNIAKKFIALPIALFLIAMPSKSDISEFGISLGHVEDITVVGVGYGQIKNNILLGASYSTDLEEAFDINMLSLSAGYVFGDHEVGSFYAGVSYTDSDWTDAEGGLAIGWMKLAKTGNSFGFSVDDDKVVSLSIGFDIGMDRKINLGVAEYTDDDFDDIGTAVSIGFAAYF